MKNKHLSALHFKNKDSGGWPGNIKLFFEDGTYRFYVKSYRIEIKPYFKLERCLYCVDKLNLYADISLGDNYTGIDDSDLESNTVIIRTQRGKNVWNACLSALEVRNIEKKKIICSQLLSERMQNIEFANYKEKMIKKQTGKDLDINALKRK